MMKLIFKVSIYILTMLVSTGLAAQRVPNEVENVDFLVTFSKESPLSWGDDDYTQTFFFIVPYSFTEPVYIRVFDPDIGGEHDEPKNAFNSITKYSIYGGDGAHTDPDAQEIDPIGNFKSGTLLVTKSFRNDARYDNKWYTFGPFNPTEGENDPAVKGYVFKVICEGVKGDDGNLYRYFFSLDPNENIEVEGANAFTYEYSFRLPQKPKIIAHIYPFIDEGVISVTQHNFDFDYDGEIVLYSVEKNRHKMARSPNLGWAYSTHEITPEEQNTTIDIQILKHGRVNNDMVFYLRNQYNQAIPFFTIPIGGPPKYKYKVNLSYTND
ncbi:MAG: hypothetical protein ABJ004_11820 [Cyclobacteriaceae bacterium]